MLGNIHYILNGLDNPLYTLYSVIKFSKEKKYNTEDARTKKFIVGLFSVYKMIDFKTVTN